MATAHEHSNELSSGVSAGVAHSGDRIHYLDNLRALAMLLGVFLHAALAYAEPTRTVWIATDPIGSPAIDVTIWFIHLFRMGLFFLLSGYFSKLLVDRRGIRGFLWNRTVRILFPFLLFYPFLLAAMIGLIVFGISYLKEPLGLLGLIAERSANSSGESRGRGPETMHLWFLYYLLWISIIAAIVVRLRIPSVAQWLIRTRLWVFTPLLLLPGIIGAGIPLPAPESFAPHWWPIAFYGVYFWGGWQLYGRETVLDRIGSYVSLLVVTIGVLFVPYYWLMPDLDIDILVGDKLPAMPWKALLVEGLLTAYLSVLITLLALWLGRRFLARPSLWLRMIADSSYWIYLLHLPVVVLLQTLLIPVSMSIWIKLALTLLITFAFTGATYLVFVRYTPLGWLLNGKRSFRSDLERLGIRGAERS